MKKILTLFFIFFSISLFAFDASTDSSKDMDESDSTNLSKKRDMHINNTKSKDVSNTETESESKTSQTSLNYDSQLDILRKIADLERSHIYPFSSCRLLTKPRQLVDFDLSCKSEGGLVNAGRCSYLQEAGKSQFNVSEVVDTTEDIKGYVNCGIYYGAVIAQSVKNGSIDFEISDKNIHKAFETAINDIYDSECTFNGDLSKILCGSVSIELNSDLKINQYNVPLYSSNKFYGHSLNLANNKSLSKTVSDDVKLSKSKSKGTSMSNGSSFDSSSANKISKKATNSMSVGKFID